MVGQASFDAGEMRRSSNVLCAMLRLLRRLHLGFGKRFELYERPGIS